MFNDRVLRKGPTRTRPVGSGAWKDPTSDITIRWSDEMPQGVQAIYREGMLLGVFNIGEPVPNVAATDITLHRLDYEAVKKSLMEATARNRNRSFHADRNKHKVPYNIESIIRKKVNDQYS
jgi:hypothetical protein